MSVDAAPPSPVGYVWPGADEEEVAASCARIARLLARAGARSVGVLPLGGGVGKRRRRRRGGGRGRGGELDLELGPLLERLAAALAGFVGGTVGFYRSWPSWPGWGGAGAAAAAVGSRSLGAPPQGIFRQLRPQVVEIVPPPCADGSTATATLQASLASLPTAVTRVLVDLGGYAAPGVVPAAVDMVEGVLTAVVARAARKAWVADLADRLPAGKSLGAILIG